MSEHEAKIAVMRYIYLMQEIEFPIKTPPITISQLILSFLIGFGLTGIFAFLINEEYSNIFTSIALTSAILLIAVELYIKSLRDNLSKYFKNEYDEDDFNSGIEKLLKN